MVSRAESAYFLKTLKYTSESFTLKTQQIRAMSMAQSNGKNGTDVNIEISKDVKTR